MTLNRIFAELTDVFSGSRTIERAAQKELQRAIGLAQSAPNAVQLPKDIITVMQQSDVHPVCAAILQTPLPWAPPKTSSDPLYTAHSGFKAHVEILGPDGLVKSDVVRMGLYGMLPHSEYGIRTHPAEEIYIMLAGAAYWKRDTAPFAALKVPECSYHPSWMPHASKTTEKAFMSVYAWYGDLSKDAYTYEGLPKA